MKNHDDIRELISRNSEELKAYGILPYGTEKTGKRGRPRVSYYLNEEQALLLCMFSRTETAKAVRADLPPPVRASPRIHLQVGTSTNLPYISEECWPRRIDIPQAR